MSGFGLGLIVGLLVGAPVGYLIAAIMVISADADRRRDQMRGGSSGKVIEFPDPKREKK